ncbi:MAG: hypothetical protein GX684_03410 [Ruminococcaceae bacterium]|nr:hypothetical protein [Oscillospiraceae bacterium]
MNKKSKNTSAVIAVAVAAFIILSIIIILVAGTGKKKEPVLKTSPEKTAIPQVSLAPDVGGAPAAGFEAFFSASRVYPATDTDLQQLLPLSLENGIQIESYGFYNGVYVESGSMEMAYNIIAIKVKNTGSTVLNSTKITIPHSGGEASFIVKALPKDESVIVLEANASDFSGKPDLSSAKAEEVSYYKENEIIKLSNFEIHTKDGEITVKNTSGSDITGKISIHFKYLFTDMLLGGADFSLEIENGLKDGEKKIFPVSAYINSACRITFISQN